jgi:hypothetical protein
MPAAVGTDVAQGVAGLGSGNHHIEAALGVTIAIELIAMCAMKTRTIG